jgi:hypothetical protein
MMHSLFLCLVFFSSLCESANNEQKGEKRRFKQSKAAGDGERERERERGKNPTRAVTQSVCQAKKEGERENKILVLEEGERRGEGSLVCSACFLLVLFLPLCLLLSPCLSPMLCFFPFPFTTGMHACLPLSFSSSSFGSFASLSPSLSLFNKKENHHWERERE